VFKAPEGVEVIDMTAMGQTPAAAEPKPADQPKEKE